MKKKKLGILLGLFFGIWGLLGLLSCETKSEYNMGKNSEKDEFLNGWIIVFVIRIVVSIILTIVYISMLSNIYMY